MAETNCPICICPVDNMGDHRIVSLSCGHLFGESCIRKWIKSAKKCPVCNVKAIPSQIRPVYTQNVVVSEAAETKKLKLSLIETKKKLAEEIRDRRKLAINLELKNQECSSLKQQVQNYKNKVKDLQTKLSMALASSSSGARNENISDYNNDNIVASMNVKQKKYVAPPHNTSSSVMKNHNNNMQIFASTTTTTNNNNNDKNNNNVKKKQKRQEEAGGRENDVQLLLEAPLLKKQKIVKKRVITKEMAQKIELNRQRALAIRKAKMGNHDDGNKK